MEQNSGKPDIFQSSNSYKSHLAYLSNYKEKRIPMANLKNNEVQLSASTSIQITFDIPKLVVNNLSRSIIDFNFTVPAHTTGTKYSHVHLQPNLFRNYSFGNSSSKMVELQNADVYCDMHRHRYSRKQLENNDPSSMFFVKHSDDENINYVTKPYLPYNLSGKDQSVQVGAEKGEIGSFERYVSASPLGADMTVHVAWPLSIFKSTLFDMDKDLVFNETMQLTFDSQFLDRMIWGSDGLSGKKNPVQHSGTPKLFNVYLRLAVQDNKQIAEAVKAQMLGTGIELNMPWIQGYKKSTGQGATSNNLSIDFNNNSGDKLKEIVSGFYNSSSYNFAFDRSNIQGTKIKSLKTSLNADNLQFNGPVVCYNGSRHSFVNPAANSWTVASASAGGTQSGDDWKYHEQILKNTPFWNYRLYQNNWLWIETFGLDRSENLDNQSVRDIDIDDGLPLDPYNQNYTMEIETPNASPSTTTDNNYGLGSGTLDVYIFGHFTRKMVIDQNGFRRV